MAIAPHAGGAAGTLTYFAAPLAGAKTVMLEEFSPEGALALIEKEKATAIGVVPTHLVRMLEADTSKYDLSSLRFIRSAGGYLSPQMAEEAETGLRGVHHQRPGHPGHGVGLRLPGGGFQGPAPPDRGPDAARQQGPAPGRERASEVPEGNPASSISAGPMHRPATTGTRN